MRYFSLRKQQPERKPEHEAVEEEVDETPDDPEEQPEPTAPPASWAGALGYGLLGPGRWIAARFNMGAAWAVHAVIAWACVFYGGWIAAGLITAWLLAVALFVPREQLERLAEAIERRDRTSPTTPAEEVAEPVEEEPQEPDPQDVVDLVRDLIGADRGILLTALRRPLHAPDTRAVREALTAAGIGVRPGVRTAAGNGPGVHRDDLPPLAPADDDAPVEVVAAGEAANTNTNNKLRVQSREGMTIINDPADRHRTHTLKKP